MIYRCLRCNWQGTDTEADGHADESGHARCAVCLRSLQTMEPAVCMPCVGRTRADLAEIETAYALLPDELDQLGSSALDSMPGGRSELPLPGGDVLALLGPGSRGLTQIRGILVPGGWRDDSHAKDEQDDDPQSVAFELSRWEDHWRLCRGEPAATCQATVVEAKAYLNARLDWAANGLGYHPVHPQPLDVFDEFARDMQRLLTRLRHATATDDKPERSPARVTCFDCDAVLIRYWSDRGLNDVWTCPRCKREYTHAEYNLAVAARMADQQTDPDAILPSTEIRAKLGISESQLRVWQNRGQLAEHGRDERGRTMFRFGDCRRLADAARAGRVSA